MREDYKNCIAGVNKEFRTMLQGLIGHKSWVFKCHDNIDISISLFLCLIIFKDLLVHQTYVKRQVY